VGIAIVVAFVPLHIFGMLYLYRLYRKHARFYRDAMVAEGVVIGTRKFSGGDGPDHFARISYTVAGTEYMLRDGVWTQRRRYKRGQLVKVYYLPESPGSGRIADPSAPVIYIGGALLIAAIVVILLTTLWNELWNLQ
jgi:hypothetical protein